MEKRDKSTVSLGAFPRWEKHDSKRVMEDFILSFVDGLPSFAKTEVIAFITRRSKKQVPDSSVVVSDR